MLIVIPLTKIFQINQFKSQETHFSDHKLTELWLRKVFIVTKKTIEMIKDSNSELSKPEIRQHLNNEKVREKLDNLRNRYIELKIFQIKQFKLQKTQFSEKINSIDMRKYCCGMEPDLIIRYWPETIPDSSWYKTIQHWYETREPWICECWV